MTYDTISDAVTIAGGEGTLLASRYRVVRRLGQGGMGSVWLVEDTQLDNKPFAVKMLPSILVSNKRAYRQLKDEALVAMKLTHPNIVTLRAFEENNGNPFLVMDYVEGQTLDDYLAEYSSRLERADRVEGDGRGTCPACPPGGMPEADVLRILRPVAAALDYAHREGVVHRDVKPANVMIRKDGHPFILDFGIAREIQETMTKVTGKLSSGTLLYMSPEQLMGEPPKPAQDVYSFAAMVYECLKGEPPFVRGAIEDQIKNKAPEPLVGASVPLARSVMAGLAKKSEDRPSTCTAVLRESGVPAASAGTGNGSGKSAASPNPQLPGGSRSRATVGILIAAALALAVLGGWWYYRQEQVCEQTRIAAETARQKSAAEAAKRKAEEEARQKKAAEEAKRKAEEEARQRVAAEEAKRKAEEEVRQKKTAEAAKNPADDIRKKVEEAKARLAEQSHLETRIRIRISDARAKMDRVKAFRADPDGLEAHIASADAEWNRIEAFGTPADLEDARAKFDVAQKAEEQIGLDLDWLERNKSGRDAARAASKEIAALLKGDVVTFKASTYAAEQYGEGERLRAEGKAAFTNGDFAEAGRLMGEAKKKFAEAAQEAKAFFVKTTLQSAQAYFDAGKWQDCIAEADKVLGWDAGNESATKLKSEAESHLVPTLHVLAKVDGREVSAKVKAGDENFSTPFVWKLKEGSRYGPYEVSYESGGKRYYGKIDPVTVDWRGVRVVPVMLKEYTGPNHGDTKTISLPGGATMEMIYVAPGTFTMGSPSTEDGRFDDETQHEVTLSKGFWLGKYEVTQAQWQSVMGENPSKFPGGNHPVENVSWDDCQSFVRKVNSAQSCGARLPTEAEWEYACRAGSTGAYAGNGNLNDMGWYGENSGSETHPVGQKQANAWGFHDMHGNVWEWCNDFGDYGGDTTDPTGPTSGGTRVLRGGGWNGNVRGCRSAFRNDYGPDLHDCDGGFRLCCSAGSRESSTEQENSRVVAQDDGGGAGHRDEAKIGATRKAKTETDVKARVPVMAAREALPKNPEHGQEAILTLPGGATMEMIYVASGTFMMGSPATEEGRFYGETQHLVMLTKGFWLGKYEVTQAQWQSVMGENPSTFKSDIRPVETVSWEDGQSFIRKINSVQNCGARLPTEAEWEYACRAGSTGPYAGNGNLDEMGWYDDNSGNKTHPVGQKQANAWGFYDMHGNVWEWCGDWYGDYDGDTSDPTGPASGESRALRGGGWDDNARLCRSAFRLKLLPTRRDDYCGLRLCCSAEPCE